MSNPPDTYVLELVAAHLAGLTGSSPEQWRAQPELRKSCRDNARSFIQNLEEKGVKTVAAKPSLVERSAKELAIVPAHIAYQIADEP